MPRGTTDSLGQAALVAEKTGLVCIQDGYKTHFRQVETFTEQVDTYQHVIFAFPQVLHDLYAFNSVYV